MTGLLSSFLPAIVLASTLLALGVLVTVVRTIRPHEGRRPAARGLAIASLLTLLAAMLSPWSWPPEREGWGDLVLRPGDDSLGRLGVLHTDPTSLAAVLLVLNVALFVPFPCFSVLGWGRPRAVLFIAAMVSISIEAAQFVALSRVAATDDVILNMLGALLGIGFGVLVSGHRSASVLTNRRRQP